MGGQLQERGMEAGRLVAALEHGRAQILCGVVRYVEQPRRSPQPSCVLRLGYST
jgi:hypothetical protein